MSMAEEKMTCFHGACAWELTGERTCIFASGKMPGETRLGAAMEAASARGEKKKKADVHDVVMHEQKEKKE